jgi:uncharacterized membrane protein
MQQHATITEVPFVGNADLRSTGRSGGRPIHNIPAAFSAAYFVGALVTDLAYVQTPDVMWERFSIWLITAGMILAGAAVVAYVFDLFTGRQIDRPTWARAIGYALVIVLSLINAFVHSRDGYTAVVPTGLVLSGLVTVVLLLTALTGTASADRSRVGG